MYVYKFHPRSHPPPGTLDHVLNVNALQSCFHFLFLCLTLDIMHLPKRRRNAIFPGLLKELLDIVRRLNKAHGKTLPCGARCFGVMCPDVNSQIEDASPMLGLRPAGNQVVLLGSEPVVFHLKEMGPVQSVCLMPLGVPKKSVVLHTTSVAKEATDWEKQSSDALFLHTDTHFVLPPANSRMSHVLVTPLVAVRGCFVEEDQPFFCIQIHILYCHLPIVVCRMCLSLHLWL